MFSAPASATESYPCGDNLTAVLYDIGMLVITGTGPMKDYSLDEDMAPWGTGVNKIAIGSGVTSIGSYAFYKCENLTSEISPANAWDKRILWKSSDPASISVEDGKITVLKAGIATITATSVDGSFEAKCLVRVPVTFEDVDADAYYSGAVWWAVLNHITSGTSEKTFSPDMPCTRAQIVTLLHRYYVSIGKLD